MLRLPGFHRHSPSARPSSPAPAYPVHVQPRDFAAEPLPPGDVECFDAPDAISINRARLSNLESLALPLQGKSVLDVGCGVGHLAQFFVERQCRVVCLDARPENIQSLRQRYPGLQAHQANIELGAPAGGPFDVVFSYGLLYHLENPVAGLRNMAAACGNLVLLETIVCDHDRPIVLLEDESKSSNQALGGIASRPSPSYVVTVLDRVGLRYIYAPKTPPDHPDFQFKWLNNMESARDGHNLRCIFVAARSEIANDRLICLSQP